MIPLVLVHGFMGGGAQWAGQKAALSQDYEVIALDLPGFGENAHLPVLDRIEGFADWAIAELHRLNLPRYHLLGHSMGGMVVQEMLRRDAQRIESLVLYSTGSVGILPGRFETISTSKARAAQEGAAATARRISATWFLQRAAAEGYEPCAQIAEKSSLAAIQAGLTAMEAWTGAALLQEIDLRTLVLWAIKIAPILGSKRICFGARYRRQSWPWCRDVRMLCIWKSPTCSTVYCVIS